MYKYEFAQIIECEGKSDEDIQNVIGKIRELITQCKGRITKEDVWGKKDLTYAVNKQNYGYYMFTIMMMDPAEMVEFNKQIRLISGLMRYLLINLDKEPGYAKQQLIPKVTEEQKAELAEEEQEEAEEAEEESVKEEKKKEKKEVKKVEKVKTEKKEEVKEEEEQKEEPKKEKVKKVVKKAVKKEEKKEEVKEEKPAKKEEKKVEEKEVDSKKLDQLLDEIL